jgi:hypothetical protein
MMNTDATTPGQGQPSRDLRPLEALSHAVIQRALIEEGPGWAIGPDGRWWCEIVGLAPDYVCRLALEDGRMGLL